MLALYSMFFKVSSIKILIKTGHLKKRQIYFTTLKLVQMSNVCIINGLHMHQILILELFELHRVQISVQDFVLIDIYFFVLLLWVFEFGRIFELHKMHWIKQNWLTIIQGKSKRCIIISHQAFWNVKLLFEGKFWHKTLKIRLCFIPKNRSQLLGAHAKICVTYPIMPMLSYLLVNFNKNM